MCAINPTHKKRIILDVYTSDTKITAQEFTNRVLDAALEVEHNLNNGPFRWHVKETDEQPPST